MRLGSYGLRCTPVSFLGGISPHTIGAHQMVDCGRETRRCDMFGTAAFCLPPDVETLYLKGSSEDLPIVLVLECSRPHGGFTAIPYFQAAHGSSKLLLGFGCKNDIIARQQAPAD